MDTLTHALSGALIARLIAARPEPLAAANAAAAARWTAPWDGRAGAPATWQFVLTGFLAGAFPDIDALVQLAGDRAYLMHHRGVTHSLLLWPLWAALVAWLMSRCFAVTRTQRGGWKSLYAVSLAAIAIHIAGDWITQFGTMLLAPLSDHRFGLGVQFIIDLTFTGLLAVGLLLAAVFPRRRWPAAVGLAAVCAWVGVAWVGKQEALAVGHRFADAMELPQAQVEAMPRPVSPFNWTVTVYDGERYHVAHVNTRRNEPVVADASSNFLRRFSAPYQPVPAARWEIVYRLGNDITPEWVRTAWLHESFAFYRWFAAAPALVKSEEVAGANGAAERCAWFRDLRFEFPGRGESPFRYGVCLEANGEARVFKLEGEQRLPV
jgi:inner membrane protein